MTDEELIAELERILADVPPGVGICIVKRTVLAQAAQKLKEKHQAESWMIDDDDEDDEWV